MKRVTSVGGVFFKCKDPKVQKEWYARYLGLVMDKYGTSFEWRQSDDKEKKGLLRGVHLKMTQNTLEMRRNNT